MNLHVLYVLVSVLTTVTRGNENERNEAVGEREYGGVVSKRNDVDDNTQNIRSLMAEMKRNIHHPEVKRPVDILERRVQEDESNTKRLAPGAFRSVAVSKRDSQESEDEMKRFAPGNRPGVVSRRASQVQDNQLKRFAPGNFRPGVVSKRDLQVNEGELKRVVLGDFGPVVVSKRDSQTGNVYKEWTITPPTKDIIPVRQHYGPGDFGPGVVSKRNGKVVS